MDRQEVAIAGTDGLAPCPGSMPSLRARAVGSLAMGALMLGQASCALEVMPAPPANVAPGAMPETGPENAADTPGTPAGASTGTYTNAYDRQDRSSTDPCVDDRYEPNDGPVNATVFAYSFIDSQGRAYGMLEAVLCSGNADWYFIPTELLDYTRNVLQVRVLARDAGWCGLVCGDPELLPGPENTITVEMYDATGTWLMTGNVSERGIVGLDVQGEPVAHDLFLRIVGPASAEYPYRLHVGVQDFEGEDECEC